ncbi:MDIS1-interacting receptor like kinase 2, partial [Linum grandiflorum]
ISTQVGNLSFLKLLGLYNNRFVGEISSEIGRFRRLLELDLFDNTLGDANNIHGSIPLAFGNLSSLQMFYGDKNHLSGRVPATLGRLKNIQLLGFQGNNLFGEIPSSIFNLSSLTEDVVWIQPISWHSSLEPWIVTSKF